MRKEQITDKEAICLLIIFYIGSSLLLGVGGEAKNDAWISGIVGVILALPMILVYARLLSLFPEKSLFDMFDLVFGKVIGKIFTVVYIWYSFHLGALVIRNFGTFINTVAMPETPLFVPLLCLGIVGILTVRSGLEVMGRMSAYLLPLLLFIMFSVQLMAIPQLHLNYMKPILGNGFLPVLKGGFNTFSFPFAESVILIGVFDGLKNKKSPYKVYLKGTAFAGLFIVIITLRNTLILGGLNSKVYFPAHVAVSRISIGAFLQRIELAVAVVFILGVFIKCSICLLTASKGISKLFNLSDYRSIVIQLGLLMVYFSFAIYDRIFEMREWAFNVYSYYAFPFQVIFPLIWLITAEIKVRMNKKEISKSM
ncbi:endospore germination permease [Bacillus sp. ISL-7]|uniref:GerAB/ArcD/ProY family transporter n=1 Tax=Bacillus sp. ISL-7 TaxID=2819136 RepID=UPI001BE7F5FD|nr:endospore germination permease [Bacillus sp. ISL-7]MBT2736392.1 endospore germination permease [Bacillus sp. ISL-7]